MLDRMGPEKKFESKMIEDTLIGRSLFVDQRNPLGISRHSGDWHGACPTQGHNSRDNEPASLLFGALYQHHHISGCVTLADVPMEVAIVLIASGLQISSVGVLVIALNRASSILGISHAHVRLHQTEVRQKATMVLS